MKKVLFFIVVFVFLLSRCIYQSSSNLLTDDELAWLTCSDVLPYVDFISNDGGDTARLRYSSLRVDNFGQSYSLFEKADPAHEATAGYKMSIKPLGHKSPLAGKFTGSFEIRKPANSDSAIYAVRLGTRATDMHCNFFKRLVFELDGTTLDDCVMVDSTNSRSLGKEAIPDIADKSQSIEKFIISKKYGLVYFKLQSGEEYKRVFN